MVTCCGTVDLTRRDNGTLLGRFGGIVSLWLLTYPQLLTHTVPISTFKCSHKHLKRPSIFCPDVVLDGTLWRRINCAEGIFKRHISWILWKTMSLSYNDLEKVIHAFITSRLDYCNSLYLGLPLTLVARLQMVQNAAARLLTNTKKCEHITPVLASLHWLPVQSRIQFKTLLLVFKALHGLASSYIADIIHPHVAPRSLRSSSQGLLHVPRSRLKQKGDRAFSVAGPQMWNQLPLDIRNAPSITLFKSRLKTHLFTLALWPIPCALIVYPVMSN